MSDSAGDFAGAQATSASVNMAGFTVNNSFYATDISFPGSVGTSVGMGDFDTKGNTFSAEITFCHNTAPPLGSHNDIILADFREKSKGFFKENWEVVKKP